MRWEAPRKVARAAALAAGLLALALPAVAHGGYVEGGMNYKAWPGERNQVTFWHDVEAGAWKLQDAGVSGLVAKGSLNGCSIAANIMSCPDAVVDGGQMGGFGADLGDGDDTAVVLDGMPHLFKGALICCYGARLTGGTGADVLDAGPSGHPTIGDPADPRKNVILADNDWAQSWVIGDARAGLNANAPGSNDILVGGIGMDRIEGGPGDDIMFGKEGGDQFDFQPYWGTEDCVTCVAWWYTTAGADIMRGGPGSDEFNLTEGAGRIAPDTITCDEGDELARIAGFFPGNDSDKPGDIVALDGNDSVTDDCEEVAVGITCPEQAEDSCIGSTQVAGRALPAGAAASAAKRRGGRKIVLGRNAYKGLPGETIGVAIRLKGKRVRKVLGKRKSMRVRQTARARSGKKKLKLRGKRFVIRRD